MKLKRILKKLQVDKLLQKRVKINLPLVDDAALFSG